MPIYKDLKKRKDIVVVTLIIQTNVLIFKNNIIVYDYIDNKYEISIYFAYKYIYKFIIF